MRRRESALHREESLRAEYAPSRLQKADSEVQKLMEYLQEEGVDTPSIYTPDTTDVFNFIANRSRSGKTVIHTADCPQWGTKANDRCGCEKNMSYGAVRSLKFTLQAAFRDAGRVGTYDPRTGTGNPCMHTRIDRLLEMIEKQQCAAGVTQAQAALIDTTIFNKILDHTQGKWMQTKQANELAASAEFARDTCFYALLWESGLRAGEALRLNANQITTFRTSDKAGAYIAVAQGKAHSSFRVTIETRLDERGKPHRRSFVRCLSLWTTALGDLGIGLTGPLFPTLREDDDGAIIAAGRCTWADTSRRYNQSLEEAGFSETAIRSVTLHSFHGSRAAREAREGIPMEETIKNMRWSAEMYKYYTEGREPLTIEGIVMTTSS